LAGKNWRETGKFGQKGKKYNEIWESGLFLTYFAGNKFNCFKCLCNFENPFLKEF
jgi:hypothetical protein